MSGTIPLSMTQQLDANGRPLAGGKLYFFQSGTDNPQSAYQDTGFGVAHPNPLPLDAAGRIPNFYLADGRIKIRLDDRNDVTVLAVDNLLVIGPTSSAAAAGSIEASSLATTGDIKIRYDTGTLDGWVRLNGRTLGSALSGATERANADTQALYVHLWDEDAALAVSTGRGATALDDFNANKTIALPDCRGRALWGLDGMGATSAARMNTLASTTLGGAGGLQTQSVTLSLGQLPTFTPAGTIAAITPAGTVSYAGQFTPAGTISYAGNFTPAGSVSTPTGTVSKPNVTITESAHSHTYARDDFTALGAGGGVLQVRTGETTVATSSASTGITAALDSTPTFTGSAVTFTGTAAAMPAATLTGTPGTLPGATFAGSSVTPVFTGAAIGSGDAISISSVPPALFITVYIKL